jgi:hypothetical protein
MNKTIPSLGQIADELDQTKRTTTSAVPGYEGDSIITISDRMAKGIATWLRAWQIIIDMREINKDKDIKRKASKR